MPYSTKSERIVAEDIAEATWIRLRRLTSSALCRKLIEERWTQLSPDVLDRKSAHVAWAVKTALGYWQTEAPSLNARILLRYYAVLQISIAEHIAASPKASDLHKIQRHTEAGHGLFTITPPGGQFPNQFYIGCVENGHFPNYCRFRKIELSDYTFQSRPKNWEAITEDNRSKLITLDALMARIPELQNIVKECLSIKPKSFQIFNDTSFGENAHVLRDATTKNEVSFGPGVSPTNAELSTFISLIPLESDVDLKDIEALEMPFEQIIERSDQYSGLRLFSAFLWHPVRTFWHENVALHKSGYCGTSCVEPFWRTRDMFVLHFTVLYALSIIVRYLPSLWHDIEDGGLNNFRALLEQYIVIVDKVLPKIAIEQITGRKIAILHPDTMFAPT